MKMLAKNALRITALIFPVALSACAGLSSEDSGGLMSKKYGNDQIVHITTSPENVPVGVHCLVENKRGAWDVDSLPSHVDVTSSDGAMYVTCNGSDGWHGRVRVDGDVKAIGTLDKIVFGTSMNKYPDEIVIPMSRDTSHDVIPAVNVPITKATISPDAPEVDSGVIRTHHIHHIKKKDCDKK